MPPIDRNQLCPCGSGKRYKHCHGSLARAPTALHAQAQAAYRSGALRQAEALYRQALRERPDDAEVLNGLSAVLFERLRYGEALGLFRDAADRTGWADPLYRQNLGLVLAKLMATEANARQDALVERYLARGDSPQREAPPAVRVSTVLVAGRSLAATQASIASIVAQSSKDCDFVVVHEMGAMQDATVLAEWVAKQPLGAVIAFDPGAASDPGRDPATAAGARFARAANLGARRARGEYLAFLTAGDRFTPDRIETMASQVAGARPGWGFSQVEFLSSSQADDRQGEPGERAAPCRPEPRTAEVGRPPVGDARDWDSPSDQFPSFALRHRNLAVSDANLFVARSLFEELGGFREIAHPGWDFALRAAQRVEPVIVEARLYAIDAHDRDGPASQPDAGERESVARRRDQILAGIVEGVANATNEFSPHFTANRSLVLQAEFRAGRADRIPIPALRAIADEWRSRLESRRHGGRTPIPPVGVDRGTIAPPPADRASIAASVAVHAQAKIAIVVLGVYRSGTSALTRVLNLCGATLPQNVMAARLDLNRKGFWEAEAVVDLDARMLKRFGAEWHSADVEIPTGGTMVDEFLATARDVMTWEYGAARLVLLKDPRMCVLAPLWHRALVQSGYRPAYVVSVRHPFEIAGSLARSLRSYGGLPLERGLALWRTYMGRAVAFADTVDAKSIHVRYDDLLADWREVVDRITRRLDVPLDIEGHAAEVDRFLDPDLRSQRPGVNLSDERHGANESGAEASGAEAANAEASRAQASDAGASAAVIALYRQLLDRCARDAA